MSLFFKFFANYTQKTNRIIPGNLFGFITILLFIILTFVPVSFSAQKNKGVKNDLFSVCFPTEQDGWACGRWGTVLNSTDGGKSWTKSHTGIDYTLNAISFTDTKNGWAVGDEGTIIHTKNGGKTWEIQKSPVTTFLMGVSFADTKNGWIVTEKTTILNTTDGGKTWQVQFCDGDFILKDVSFCDAQNGWAVGEFGYTYHTKNGGKTWKHQAGFFGFSQESFDMVGGEFLFDVEALDPMTAWAVGIDGYVTRTTDGGKTWQHIKDSIIPKSHLFGVTSNGNGTIVFGGNGNMVVSIDNGKHFSVSFVEPHIKYGWLYGITQKGTNGFVAVGKESWIYISDSKGQSWQQINILGDS